MSSDHTNFNPPNREPKLTAKGIDLMTTSPYLVAGNTSIPIEDLSVVLIGPNEEARAAATGVLSRCGITNVKEQVEYPDERHEVPRLLSDPPDVILIDLDGDPEFAMSLVHSICAQGSSTVVVYSAETDPDMLVRCMRAGAREFLNVPFTSLALEEALTRAAMLRPSVTERVVRAGRLHVFVGAKGGVGVTSIACNFAVALAQAREQKTLLIDLDLPLGDAALNLGIVSEFSTINALQAADRLDGALLSKLLAKHQSGLRVLAAPGRFPHFAVTVDGMERLLAVARQEFDNVVVDAGSRMDLAGTALHREASSIYLVTQAGIPELRNANRLINQVFTPDNPRVEVVLNRYQSRTLEISDGHINDALTRPVRWKIPNDHALVRKMQLDASPLVLSDNPIAATIRKMARLASGEVVVPEQPKKKKGIGSLFDLGRKNSFGKV